MLKVAILASLLALACTGAVAGESTRTRTLPKDCQALQDHQVEPADYGTAQCFPSPDGRKLVVVRGGRISVEDGAGTAPAGVMDGGQIVWNPASTGFAISDHDGMGFTSYFSYVDVRRKPLRRDKSLRWAAARLYAKTFRCAGPGVYIHTWVDGWQDGQRLRLLMQEGAHSEGCVHPDVEENEIGLIADPATGRIETVLTQAQVQQAWCTPAQRLEYGYCYVVPERRQRSATPQTSQNRP